MQSQSTKNTLVMLLILLAQLIQTLANFISYQAELKK
jgi:hypothetical protein